MSQLTLPTLRRCLAVLRAEFELGLRWRGPALDRLLDERHASVQSAWAERLARWTWEVLVEASFNHYGERGRIDVLAFQPQAGALLVVEIKTEIADLQELLGSLDVKARVAPGVARGQGWPAPHSVTRALVVEDTSTNRRRVRQFRALFSGYELQGKAALSWLCRPSAQTPRGLLVLTNLSAAHGARANNVGSRRIRVSGAAAAGSEHGIVAVPPSPAPPRGGRHR